MGTGGCSLLSDDGGGLVPMIPSSEHTAGPSFGNCLVFSSCGFAPKSQRFSVGSLGCRVSVGRPLAAPDLASGLYSIAQCCGEALSVLSLGTASVESRVRRETNEVIYIFY